MNVHFLFISLGEVPVWEYVIYTLTPRTHARLFLLQLWNPTLSNLITPPPESPLHPSSLLCWPGW